MRPPSHGGQHGRMVLGNVVVGSVSSAAQGSAQTRGLNSTISFRFLLRSFEAQIYLLGILDEVDTLGNVGSEIGEASLEEGLLGGRQFSDRVNGLNSVRLYVAWERQHVVTVADREMERKKQGKKPRTPRVTLEEKNWTPLSAKRGEST